MKTFRNVQNLRHLSIDERCIDIDSQAFATMTKVDFITLRGLCSLSPFAFKNTSRIHSLTIFDSSFSISANAFNGLSHVNEVCAFNILNPYKCRKQMKLKAVIAFIKYGGK